MANPNPNQRALRVELYRQVHSHLHELTRHETDIIALMSTIVCELFHRLPGFDWVGFYRVTAPGILKIGPYQGTHGCLTIPFNKGVCGKCAREGETQIVPDVSKLAYHIACSASTRSEIVIPVVDKHGHVRAVLDIDSNSPSHFDEEDARQLHWVCTVLTPAFEIQAATSLPLPQDTEQSNLANRTEATADSDIKANKRRLMVKTSRRKQAKPRGITNSLQPGAM